MPVEHYIIKFLSTEWIIVNFFTIGTIFFVMHFGLKIGSREKKVRIGRVIAFILLARLAFIHPYQLYIDRWDMIHSLPLHLCGISAILSGVLFFRFNQFLYEFLVLIGIPGALQALITPELTLGYDRVLLVEYFVSHGGIILSGLYLTFVLNNRPRIGSWKGVILYPQLLLLFIHSVNSSIGSNYMYTVAKPIAENPLIMGEHPYYYIGFEIIGILHVLLFYYLFTIDRNKKLTVGISK